MREPGDDGRTVEVPAGLCRLEGQRLVARDPVLGMLTVSRRKSVLVTRWSPLGCEEDTESSGDLREAVIAVETLGDSNAQDGTVSLEKAIQIYATEDDQEDVIVVRAYGAACNLDSGQDTSGTPRSPTRESSEIPASSGKPDDISVCKTEMFFWLPTLSAAEVVARIQHLFKEERPKPSFDPPAVTKKARQEDTLNHFKVPPHVSLTALLDLKSTLPLLHDPQVCEELLTHLPATQRNVADLEETLRSPQFIAVVRNLDNVIHSGHGDVLLRSMGVRDMQPPLLVCTLLNIARAMAPFVASLVKHFGSPTCDDEQLSNEKEAPQATTRDDL